ncbi:hypothetical protein DMC30DRAFT_403441 [Rhodotorula diobovata]|uniref:Uncharacterized protein n=1 Tax=Rhodotorula diobovata TaxID=5288 RepID=A0A5C5FPV3_9BASI|nr:hypothetical protein DMC30DRAFT_403441 [Rhodotorula diobovata]
MPGTFLATTFCSSSPAMRSAPPARQQAPPRRRRGHRRSGTQTHTPRRRLQVDARPVSQSRSRIRPEELGVRTLDVRGEARFSCVGGVDVVVESAGVRVVAAAHVDEERRGAQGEVEEEKQRTATVRRPEMPPGVLLRRGARPVEARARSARSSNCLGDTVTPELTSDSGGQGLPRERR